MAWKYKSFLEKIKSERRKFCDDDLEGTAKIVESLASWIVAIITGIIFGPSYLVYRFAKFLFETEKPLPADSLWMYWAGQIIIPACAKKGVLTDLESLDPGNSDERNICFCFNLPVASETMGESVLREVRNRIASTQNIGVLEVNQLYDLTFSKGQIRISGKGEYEPLA